MEFFKKQAKWYFLSALFLSTTIICYAVFSEQRNGILTVAFLDVGQGDAIFIESPSGAQVLIDGGRGKSVLRELSKVIPFYDRDIDVVLATHPDKDHIGGLPSALKRFRADYVVESDVETDSAIYAEIGRLADKEGARRILARRGQIFDLGGGALLYILFPDRSLPKVDTNTASIVVKLAYGGTSFLFTGDSPRSIEEYLAYLDGENLNVDVLKAGHHGSKTSTSDTLLGIATPAYAVISAGKDNQYGHPHKEVLEALKRFGVKIVSTYKQGIIVFKSDGRKIWVR